MISSGGRATVQPVTGEKGDPVIVKRDAKAGAGGHGQGEILVVQRCAQDFFGQKKRAEQLGPPLKIGKGRKEAMVPTPPSSMVPP